VVHQIQEFIISWITVISPIKRTAREVYDTLLRSQISEDFNDASLCIQQLWLQQVCIHPADIGPDDDEKISTGSRICLEHLIDVVCRLCNRKYVRRNRKRDTFGYFEPNDLADLLNQRITTGCYETRRILAMISNFWQHLNLMFERTAENQETQYRLNLGQISKHFSSVAVTAENLLLHMMEERDHSLKKVESLETGMAGLGM
jgi:hypothetical protein